ncbi:hypothetical protein ABV89_18625 [Priestia aryabhattai]|nr:hypothetical protein VL11_25900 [Priestia aryabhattai]KMN98207.1 hypothetical protein ABV89_18625 [Priestia aryabhattai]
MIFSLLLFTIIALVTELPNLQRKNTKKERWIFLVFMFFGMGLTILYTLQVPMPNLLDALTAIFNYPNTLLP